MKKLFLILTLFASLSLQAQFVTTLAKNAPETQEDGFLYYLPQNLIKLEFTIEETNYLIGPYAEYASSLLGLTDYIKENKTEYAIKNVDIQSVAIKDPNAVYFVANEEKSKEPLPNIIVDSDGVILAFGYDSIPASLRIDRDVFDNDEVDNMEITEASFFNILDTEIEEDDDDDDEEEEGSTKNKLTKEDKAKAAVAKILKIRNAYFDLISGNQEITYGDIKYMAESLQQLENEYVSLFKGKAVTNIYKKVVYVTPEKNQINSAVSVAKISGTDGFTAGGGKGDLIKIQYDSNYSLENVNPISSDSKNASQTNKLFYRIPVETNVKILFGTTVLAEKLLNISQFGDVRTVSAKNNKILFNPNTGQIISVLK